PDAAGDPGAPGEGRRERDGARGAVRRLAPGGDEAPERAGARGPPREGEGGARTAMPARRLAPQAGGRVAGAVSKVLGRAARLARQIPGRDRARAVPREGGCRQMGATETIGQKIPQAALTLRRTYAAPRERVFRAWTDPEEIKRWWGPPGTATPDAEVDLKPGGKYRFTMRSLPDGEPYFLVGTYREV